MVRDVKTEKKNTKTTQYHQICLVVFRSHLCARMNGPVVVHRTGLMQAFRFNVSFVYFFFFFYIPKAVYCVFVLWKPTKMMMMVFMDVLIFFHRFYLIHLTSIFGNRNALYVCVSECHFFLIHSLTHSLSIFMFVCFAISFGEMTFCTNHKM